MSKLGLALALTALMVPGVAAAADTDADSTMSLEGGAEGTAFEDLTIQGEDRIRVTFARPALDLDLDPLDLAGLSRDVRLEVLSRGGPDRMDALLTARRGTPLDGLARPWMNTFATGGVARFSPNLEDVARWRLDVADSRGVTVRSFSGDEKPPKAIVWDGLTAQGAPALPGLTYSYALEAFDRAGNKRTFMGDGFSLPPYVVSGERGTSMLVAGADVNTNPGLLVEIADRMNRQATVNGLRTMVTVTATARSYGDAERLAGTAVSVLGERALGDPGRIKPETRVEGDAPEAGVLVVQWERTPADPKAGKN